MNYINILGSKLKQYNLFFPTILVGLLVIYLPSIGSLPFGDDYFYIFNNYHINAQKNPFAYWNINSDSYKSWPMTYSVLWVLFNVFGSKFFLYRIFNIFIHFLNAYLLKLILDTKKIPYSKSFTLLFLLHPLCFESIFWIFQLKTICATFFLLSSYIFTLKYFYNSRKLNLLVSFLFFVISITFKNIGIFMPFFFLYIFVQNKKKIFFLIPFFLISLVSGIESIKGITVSTENTVRAQSYEDSYFKNISTFSTKIKKINDLKRKEQRKKKSKVERFKQNLLKRQTVDTTYNKYKLYLNRYFKNNFELSLNMKKLNISINSLSFYLIAATGIHENYFVYPDLKLNTTKSMIYVSVFFIVLIFFIFYFEKVFDEYIFAMMLLFLPISGLFYVPYMEFSFAADHWFYPSLLFLILYIAKKVSYYNSKNTKTILSLLVFFFLLKTLLINLSLTSTKSHLYKNLSEAPESTILYEYLIELEKRDKNFKKALILSEKVFPFSDNKIPLINNMFSFATELKSPTLQMKYLILKIKTYLHVNNISEAMRTMHSLPPELKSSEILYLRSLIRAINHKFTSEDLKSIDSILVD